MVKQSFSLSMSTNSLIAFSFLYAFTSLVLLPLSLQPDAGLDKQETLSVISPLFVCLNECQAKDRGGTNTTVHTLIPL